MNPTATQLYNPQRIVWIAMTAVIASGAAYLAGFPKASIGVLCGAPVGMLNFYLMYTASKKQTEKAVKGQIDMGLMQRSLMRIVISMGALLLALRFGPEFLIGTLVGVVAEMITYMGDAARLFFSFSKRG